MSLVPARATLREPISIKQNKARQNSRTGGFLPPQERSHCWVVSSNMSGKTVGVLNTTVKRRKVYNPKEGLYSQNMK